MAAGMIPRPGTKLGPCSGECSHVDCAANRADAASVCHFCQKPIGYDTLHYYEQQGAPVHLVPSDVIAASPLRNASGTPYVVVHEYCVAVAVEAGR